MYQLTEQQKAFIEAYSSTICECPKNLLIKYFEDSDKFGRTYREYYSNVEDCYSIWVMALEYANKTVEVWRSTVKRLIRGPFCRGPSTFLSWK